MSLFGTMYKTADILNFLNKEGMTHTAGLFEQDHQSRYTLIEITEFSSWLADCFKDDEYLLRTVVPPLIRKMEASCVGFIQLERLNTNQL